MISKIFPNLVDSKFCELRVSWRHEAKKQIAIFIISFRVILHQVSSLLFLLPLLSCEIPPPSHAESPSLLSADSSTMGYGTTGKSTSPISQL